MMTMNQDPFFMARAETKRGRPLGSILDPHQYTRSLLRQYGNVGEAISLPAYDAKRNEAAMNVWEKQNAQIQKLTHDLHLARERARLYAGYLQHFSSSQRDDGDGDPGDRSERPSPVRPVREPPSTARAGEGLDDGAGSGITEESAASIGASAPGHPSEHGAEERGGGDTQSGPDERPHGGGGEQDADSPEARADTD